MKGTIKGLLYSGIRNTTVVELELDGNETETLEKFRGKHVDATFKLFRKGRSLDANAYFWVLADRLAARTGRPKIEIYKDYVREVGGNNQIVCVQSEAAEELRSGWEHNGLGWITDTMPSKLPGCTNVVLYYGSSTYTTGQMSRLIDLAVQDCRAIGIDTKTPEQIREMLGDWELPKTKEERE